MGTPAWRAAPTIYRGGAIRTMAAQEADALVADGPTIAFVGAEAEARRLAGSDATVRDLEGACLLPGFVDAHTHPLMLGQSSAWADLTGISAMDDLVEILRRHSQQLPPGTPCGRKVYLTYTKRQCYGVV